MAIPGETPMLHGRLLRDIAAAAEKAGDSFHMMSANVEEEYMNSMAGTPRSQSLDILSKYLALQGNAILVFAEELKRRADR